MSWTEQEPWAIEEVSSGNIDLTIKAGNRLYFQAIERQKRHASKINLSLENELQEHPRIANSKRQADLTTDAGNRLYIQAVERQKRHKELVQKRHDEDPERSDYQQDHRDSSDTPRKGEDVDLTIIAGSRLYSQALELQERQKARQKARQLDEHTKLYTTPRTTGTACNSDLSQSTCSNTTTSINAGNRLYYQAVEQFERHKSMRIEASKLPSSKLNLVADGWINSTEVEDRWEHLYQMSSDLQKAGKNRRETIEKAQALKNALPEKKVLSASRVGDMYARSMDRMLKQKIKLAEMAATLSG